MWVPLCFSPWEEFPTSNSIVLRLSSVLGYWEIENACVKYIMAELLLRGRSFGHFCLFFSDINPSKNNAENCSDWIAELIFSKGIKLQ